MSERLPRLTPAELGPDQAEVYDRIVGGPRSAGPRLFEMTDPEGRLNGPFNAMLMAPAVGDALQHLGAAVRYGTSLSDRIREMAILAVATHWESAFERYAHEPIGRAAGLTDEEILALRRLPDLHPVEPREAAALDMVRALLVDAGLDDEAFASAERELTVAEMVELTTLVGYYGTLALLMRAFAVGAPGSSSLDGQSVDS